MLAKCLYVLRRGAIRGFGNLGYIIQKCALRLAEFGFVQLTVNQRLYRLFVSSLNPQEVGMRIQSIRAAIQIRDPAGNGFLLTPG